MKAMNLKDVVLVAHSARCLDAYAYFRANGTQNVRAFACIDMSPKPIVEAESDWGDLKAAKDMKEWHDDITHDRLNALRSIFPAVFVHPLTEGERNWFVGQMMMTPTSVALLLNYDATMSVYTPEAKAIDGKLPVLYFLSNPGPVDGWTAIGKGWLATNMPHSDVVELG
jgi:hypothetical protein